MIRYLTLAFLLTAGCAGDRFETSDGACTWVVDCSPAAVAPGGPGGDSTGCEVTPVTCDKPMPVAVTCEESTECGTTLYCHETVSR